MKPLFLFFQAVFAAVHASSTIYLLISCLGLRMEASCREEIHWCTPEEPEKPDSQPYSILIQPRYELKQKDLIVGGVHLPTLDVDQSDIISRRSLFDSGSGHKTFNHKPFSS
jgi:hypothetical protein